ncbi:MAG: tetratricopeptide repeat protein [Burkholderiales bacterium]|nr:tetratricopeptide repeat protein [Burkholderiales bacterium]
MAADIDALWDYAKPAESEARFREALKTATGDGALELETQIARTYSMRRDILRAYAVLDAVAVRMSGGTAARVRIRYLLERGRALNSSGQFEQAKPLFADAFQLAQRENEVLLAIDAAHMFGFSKNLEEAMSWNQVAMRLAQGSELPRAIRWRASIANNLGSTERERGNLDAAARHFDAALKAHQRTGTPLQVRIAWWQVANVRRLQGKFDEALAIQQRLEQEMLAAKEPDEYVYDELAALYTALKRPADAARANDARKAITRTP